MHSDVSRTAPPEARRYESLALLGAGSMGAVRLVHDHAIGRDVAMKMILPEHAGDAHARLRFEREGRVQGQLEHPAIVPVHDLGFAPDGAIYFTMKRVQGESLRTILNGLSRGDADVVERYGRRRLLAAFGTVCLAVAFAHARGVVHRDIKPSNVMFGDFGEVYLLDWGVAGVRRPDHLPDGATWEQPAIVVPAALAAVTSPGDLLGTVGYMAPEQLRGEPVDERADIYSLGAVLFELLTLEPLHPRSPAASIQSTIAGADARASVRAPGRHVPRDLEALCVRATALDPARRPSSARELHDVIERVLDGDRDIERRRRIGADHAARGRIEAERALRGGPGAKEARERAVHEVHRAVVMDPHNEEALGTLTELARVPADEMASDAEAAVVLATRGVRRLMARTGALLFAPWLVGIGATAILGVRDAVPLLFAALAVICAAALAFVRSRVDRITITFATLIATNLAASLAAAAFGPFLVVPGLLTCTAIAFTLASNAEPSRAAGGYDGPYVRHAAWIASVAAFLAPVLLEAVGALPPSVAFREGALVILPRAVEFSPALTLPLLVVMNVALIVVPSVISARARDYALTVERRAFASASHLRQLLPREARAAMRGGELAEGGARRDHESA